MGVFGSACMQEAGSKRKEEGFFVVGQCVFFGRGKQEHFVEGGRGRVRCSLVTDCDVMES